MHTGALTESKRAELLAVCDIKPDRAEAAGKQHGVPYCTDYNDILKNPDIDAVHICTPHYLHAPIAVAALNAGKHVFTEKPMAMTSADAKAMIDAADRNKKKLGVCFQNRFKNTVAAARELIQSGEAGAVLGGRGIVTWHRTVPYYVDSGWRGSWKTEGGGVLINQSIHTLDLLCWLIGEIESINGRASTVRLKGVIEVEDIADAYITFKNGASAVFYATTAYVTDSPVLLEIVCEKAVMRIDDKLEIIFKDGTKKVIGEKMTATGDKAYWGNYHSVIIDEFYRSIEENVPFAVDGRQGITAIETLEAFYKSAGVDRGL
jgi:predicted dehydrogenase